MGYQPPQPFLTPDGRAVQLPPDFAAKFQGLTPAEPPPPDLAPSIPTTPPGAAQPLLPPSVSRMPTETSTPQPVPQAQAAPAQSMPAAQPQAAPSKPVQQKPTAPKRTTDADLVSGGYSAVLDEQTAALAQQADAVQQGAQAEADALSAQGEALAARNAEVDRILAERQKAAEAKMQRIEAANIEAEKAAKAYADHKVERSVDHPITAAISLILGGVGAALGGDRSGKNPALDILMQQMDKKVQLQMAERDKLRDVAGQKLGAIDRARALGDDNIATYNLAMAGEMERAARQIEEIGKRSAVASVQANAAQQVAAIRGKAAEHRGLAVNHAIARQDQQEARAQQAREAAASRGLQYAQMAQADRHFTERLKREDRQLDIEAAKYMATLTAKQKEDDAKLGIGGGGFKEVKDENGKTVKVPDVIRNHDGSPFRAATEKEAGELRDQKAAVDTVNDFVGQIVRGIKGHGGESDYFKSDDWQKQKSRIAFVKNAIRVGEKMGTLDNGSIALMDQMAGSVDPTSYWRDASAGLIQMRDNITTGFNSRLRAQPGYTGAGYAPKDSTSLPAPVKTPDDKRGEDVLRDPNRLDGNRLREELRVPLGYDPRFAQKYGSNPAYAVQQRLAEEGGMLPSQRASLEQFARAAREAPTQEQRDKAIDWLNRATKEAQAPGVRDYASTLLQSVNAAQGQEVPMAREPLGGGVR